MKTKYNLRNLTPSEMCSAMVCPAIYEMEEVASVDCTSIACPAVFSDKNKSDVYFIVGKQLNPEEVNLVKKVGEGETLIEIPKKLIKNLIEK